MKGTFFVSLVVIFSILAIPLSALPKNNLNSIPTVKPENNVNYDKTSQNSSTQTIKVLKDGVVNEYSIEDYVFGVVAAEMPALYEPEALKAQAVAAYTFALYRKSGNSDENYDITADGQTAQCFISHEEAMTRWGEKAEEYIKKLNDCITSVQGEVLTYEGKPIFAAYHAISSGITNSCKDVWGDDLPYLKSVNSPGDTLAEGFLSEVKLTSKELQEKLTDIAAPSGEPQNYFNAIHTTDNGYVTNLTYCGKEISGSKLRDLLNLRSCCFTISFSDDVFTFSVKGYGHGVGMSQNGSNYMAKQGSKYDEILLHYYKGATLQKF